MLQLNDWNPTISVHFPTVMLDAYRESREA